MASFVPYQIDYSVKNAAKTIAFSKKRVLFKFGFASATALADGTSSGPACRGSEHEVTFVWSLTTGKRQLQLDNKDLHFSASGQNGWTSDRVWQHAFTVRDAATGQSLRAIFLSQAAVNPRDNTPQHPFDLRIGGTSYFEFNALYQLGTPNMVVHRERQQQQQQQQQHHRQQQYHPHESFVSAEERRQLALAKLSSLQDIAQREADTKAATKAATTASAAVDGSAPRAMAHEETSLISFDDDPPSVPQPLPASLHQPETTSLGGTTVPTSNANNYYFASSLTLDPMLDTPTAPPPPPYASSNLYGSNPYAAPPAQPQPPSSYSSNPYGAPASENPYGMQFPENPYGLPASTAYSSSQALTPYNPSGSSTSASQPASSTYVDATGRFAFGPAPTQPPPPPVSTDYYNVGYTTSQYNSNNSSGFAATLSAVPPPPNNNNPYNLASPGTLSYGSAPSFAQPPPSSAPAAPSYGTYPHATSPPPALFHAPPHQAPPQYNY